MRSGWEPQIIKRQAHPVPLTHLLELRGDHVGISLKKDFCRADLAPEGVGTGPPAI